MPGDGVAGGDGVTRAAVSYWHTWPVRTPLIVLVGPTATGKSALAVQVANELGRRGRAAEIVNADSMLVYKGMDIGTAKPTAAERGGIAHHLIDILEVTELASVADFQVLARTTIASLRADDVIPILVGGSALYTRAITDHFDFPGSDPEVRGRWEAELARVGAPALHALLAESAPESAAQIEPGNGRRTVRALEVLELTGGHRPTVPEWTYALDDVHTFGLNLDRAELDRRIDARVEQMFADGLVDEVSRLLEVGLRDGTTAVRAIGYRQVVDYLDGAVSLEEAARSIKALTRRFFRKQLGWYRRDPRIQWLDAASRHNAAVVAAVVDSEKD